MKKFTKFNINPVVVDSNENIATVVISPLEQGFGTTIGNLLRRVLLSSIPSASVFAIKINSISHEFTPVEGVLEDVTTIVLNIKKLAIKINETIFDLESLVDQPIERWPTLSIKKNKPGVVYASDISLPAGVEIVNKDLKICEITKDIDFQLDMYITSDRGYRNASENRESLNTLKIIAIDCLFSPILKVEWKVDEEKTTRHGTTDKLTLTVATNGAIKAIDAISYAANIVIEMLKPIANFNPTIVKPTLFAADDASVVKKSVAATPIEMLGLTMRSFNCLKSNGINTIPELISISRSEAENIKNLGKKSLNEIIEKLEEHNLAFKD